ncbi:MAG: hypothetical protein OJF49_001215 [Ktedonobacterales bacterium]|jgi:hypothetical protein|nr:MAG: hypothetical protein OJF49_001215 [Ktedonobacterales bacterium]
MQAGDLLFGRRIRQNHALEHATVTMLALISPDLVVSARSNTRGFAIYADLDPDLVRRAADEALDRLRAGEAELAIHPNCGTNLAVGMSLAMVGSLFALTAMRPRTRIASAMASSLAGLAVARPLGMMVQRRLTTLPDLHDVRIVGVRRRRLLGKKMVEVLTAVEVE